MLGLISESICPEFKDEAKDLAQVISEKVKFLSEGKETVPPVQVMAIQIEVCIIIIHNYFFKT